MRYLSIKVSILPDNKNDTLGLAENYLQKLPVKLTILPLDDQSGQKAPHIRNHINRTDRLIEQKQTLPISWAEAIPACNFNFLR